MAEKLRTDERLVAMERTNLRHLRRGHLPERPALATLDLSFISLLKVWKPRAGAPRVLLGVKYVHHCPVNPLDLRRSRICSRQTSAHRCSRACNFAGAACHCGCADAFEPAHTVNQAAV